METFVIKLSCDISCIYICLAFNMKHQLFRMNTVISMISYEMMNLQIWKILIRLCYPVLTSVMLSNRKLFLSKRQ